MTNVTTMAAAPALSGRGCDRGWWPAGLAVATVAWGANQFAPLLLLYRVQLSLSAVAVDAAFGLYALGLIPGLLAGGPISDRIGRRKMLVPALGVSLLASVLLVAGGSLGVGWLFLGRLVAGVASGAAFSSGVAWIKELSLTGPEGNSPGPRRATIAMSAGFAGGPLVAGIVAQWAPVPTALAYIPHLALAAVAVPLALRAPETRGGGARARGWRPPGLGEPRFVTVVLPLAPWVFGSAAVALAYLPGLVSEQLSGQALLYGAVVTTLAAIAGIVVQPLARRVDDPRHPHRLIALALGLVVSGLLISALAAHVMSLLVVVAAVLVLGAGYGSCQVCGLLEVQRLARPENLAGLTAVYQAVSYLGFALPFLLAATGTLASPVVLLLIAAVAALLTLAWTALPYRAPTWVSPASGR